MVTSSLSTTSVPTTVDLADVQGNILRGYRKMRVRHVVLRVVDAAAARAWIGATVSDDRTRAPRITDAAHWGERPPAVCFNIGITSVGMLAMGIPQATVRSFPQPFQDGMASRAERIGDWDDSSPAHWDACYRDNAVHLIATLYANDVDALDAFQRAMMAGDAARAFVIAGQNDGAQLGNDLVHFGYRDNISQPRFAGIHNDGRYDDQPTAPLGTVLLGHPTELEELVWSLPDPAVLGRNGAFNAFRILEQDVVAFESYLDYAADEVLKHPAADALLAPGAEAKHGTGTTRRSAMRELIAAKFLGRWRNGTPLALSPHDPSPQPPVSDTAFDYTDDDGGLRCPFGSHTRRTNPRGARIVQRVANHTRRIVRRGVPYGPLFVPGHDDGIPRGLLGSFICANIAAQFEAIYSDWINLGLQDPRITGSNDPLLGANAVQSSRFIIPTSRGPIELRGFPRFTRTRGGAYTFLPSISALRWIGSV